MKRVIQKIGSRKWYGDDFISIQNEALAATEAHFKDYGAHVLTGCVVSGTDISAGVVVIDGKACRYQGETAVTFPRYLVKQETEVDNENYETGGSKPTYLEVYAVGQSTVPTGVEYVTIESSGGVRRLMDVIRDNHDHPASAITSGTIAVARIPNLDAVKISSGILAVARIPDLAAGKIASGTFADARISSSSVTQHLGNYVNKSSSENIGGNKNFTSKIGLSKVTPLSKIDIETTEQTESILRFSLGQATDSAGVDFKFIDSDLYLAMRTQFSGNYYNSLVLRRENGYIGVLKTSPQEAVDVDGNIKCTGQLIGNISASFVSSGTLVVARIPNLDASKITSGTFADARISSSSVTQHLGNYVNKSSSENIGGNKNFTSAIGVNKSAPLTKLDIKSSVSDESILRFSHPTAENDAGMDFKFIDANGSISIRTQFSGAYSDVLILKRSGGLLGVKNVSPSYALDVTGDIRASGNVFSNSDRRLKTRITSIDGALAKALDINACYYNWKDEKHGKGRQFGLIAQEVESVLPEVVKTDDNGSKVLDYAKLSALLFSALRELNTKVESLKN